MNQSRFGQIWTGIEKEREMVLRKMAAKSQQKVEI